MTQPLRLAICQSSPTNSPTPCGVKVAICGTYRRDLRGLRKAYAALEEAKCEIVSPASLDFCSERDGFVLLAEDQNDETRIIEERHLDAIQRADFVWLHAPGGYIGPSGAMEIGFAHAVGVPVYSLSKPTDVTVMNFVNVVDSPVSALLSIQRINAEPPRPALRSFQRYYEKVARLRGYDKEGVKECVLLLVEEVGELARAVRKSEGLVRHTGYSNEDQAQELADVFLYTIHLANVLNVDLSQCVQEKEIQNSLRFVQSLKADQQRNRLND